MSSRSEIRAVETLKLRFPHMFNQSGAYFEFYSEWFPDFVDLCHDLNSLLGEYRHAFYWRQTKEKFGSYRMYFAFCQPLVGPPLPPHSLAVPSITFEPLAEFEDGAPKFASLRLEVKQMVDLAAQKINAKCAVCGDPAFVERHGGWWGTLCGYHNIAAREARGDTRDRHELWAVPLTPAALTDGSR